MHKLVLHAETCGSSHLALGCVANCWVQSYTRASLSQQSNHSKLRPSLYHILLLQALGPTRLAKGLVGKSPCTTTLVLGLLEACPFQSCNSDAGVATHCKLIHHLPNMMRKHAATGQVSVRKMYCEHSAGTSNGSPSCSWQNFALGTKGTLLRAVRPQHVLNSMTSDESVTAQPTPYRSTSTEASQVEKVAAAKVHRHSGRFSNVGFPPPFAKWRN